MNILSVDLTKNEHFIALNYENNAYCFEFQTNDWSEKIDTLHKIENFDFKKLDCSAYAAGPGSFTGARLAFTFLNTLKFVYDVEMFCIFKFGGYELVKRRQNPFNHRHNNDFYYRENKTDFYTQDLKKVESLKNKLVMIEGSNANISPKLLIQRNQVAINIINMIASKSNSNLDSNEPNYVKSLTYRKINE